MNKKKIIGIIAVVAAAIVGFIGFIAHEDRKFAELVGDEDDDWDDEIADEF